MDLVCLTGIMASQAVVDFLNGFDVEKLKSLKKVDLLQVAIDLKIDEVKKSMRVGMIRRLIAAGLSFQAGGRRIPPPTFSSAPGTFNEFPKLFFFQLLKFCDRMIQCLKSTKYLFATECLQTAFMSWLTLLLYG